jgi:hypothetical protein
MENDEGIKIFEGAKICEEVDIYVHFGTLALRL